ncbi:BLUF domain-containing protein [Flagellimonas meridianipacifica]|uniref:FAD-dependent sensor of blue light n=1 Tax=Flagellimonas meridianipacifica TaxID=1080225 RepID=A0A2T0MCI9_9FLAO|nr:BLUF domain-containing protein [Allomuricauda pacifica]PRX55205.1 FAD-dependent sensor of blue light [Allomuricauda pacifica]
MHSLVYRSVAVENFQLPDIYKMLSDARLFNSKHNITGCLLYHDKKFLQLLEGEEKAVERLFKRIRKDARHHSMEIICEERSSLRLFDEWSMAFHDYGLNGTSAHLKLKQIDNFFEKSDAFMKPSTLAIPFFANVKDILFNPTQLNHV